LSHASLCGKAFGCQISYYCRTVRVTHLADMFLLELDKRFYEFVTLHLDPPWLSNLCEKIGDLNNYAIPLAAFFGLYYWLNSPRFLRFVLFLAAALLLSEAVAYLLKQLIARPRPAVEWLIYTDPRAYSFPSAHAVNSAVFGVIVGRWFSIALWKTAAIPLVIGFSRVFSNYHYPLDVVGGWILGYSIAILICRLSAPYFALQDVQRTKIDTERL